MSLIADQFFHDSEIRQAEDHIIAALSRHQKNLEGVRPPDPHLTQSYEETLTHFGELRGNGLWYPYLGSGIGNGALVELADGSVKYDFIGGIGVHIFGHSHPEVMRSALRGAMQDTIMQGNLQQNADSAVLCERFLSLANASGAKMAHCFLTSSGAMANENALKILFHRRPEANRLLAFKSCFMGRTLALAQITDKAKYRAGLPDTLRVDYIPFYGTNSSGSTLQTLSALEQHLKRYPGKYAGMCMELVQGEGGYNLGNREFFLEVIYLLRRHDLPLLIDEIQTFGRTSQPFAFQHFGLDEYADVVTVGKMSQVCATLFKTELKPKPGLISQTFTSSSVAISVANYLLEQFETSELFGEHGRNMQLHELMVQGFEQIQSRHPGWIKGPYGIGTMIAFTPFDGDFTRTQSLAKRLFKLGVIAFVAGSTVGRIRFLLPAMVVTEQDIQAVLRILEQALEEEAS